MELEPASITTRCLKLTMDGQICECFLNMSQTDMSVTAVRGYQKKAMLS